MPKPVQDIQTILNERAMHHADKLVRDLEREFTHKLNEIAGYWAELPTNAVWATNPKATISVQHLIPMLFSAVLNQAIKHQQDLLTKAFVTKVDAIQTQLEELQSQINPS